MQIDSKPDRTEGGDHLFLAVDTATTNSTIAVSRCSVSGKTVLGNLLLGSRVTHSRRLLGAIDFLLKELGLELYDFTAFVAGLGPGSFTGLRISMATMKGIAFAASRPLIGISTLDSLVYSCMTDRPVWAVLDARKKEVYCAQYEKDSLGAWNRRGKIRALAPLQIVDEINEPVCMVGDALEVYGDFFREALGSKLETAPATLNLPSASAMTLLAWNCYLEGCFLDPATAVPLYVRASDAELNLGKAS